MSWSEKKQLKGFRPEDGKTKNFMTQIWLWDPIVFFRVEALEIKAHKVFLPINISPIARFWSI